MRIGYEVFHPEVAELVAFYVDVLSFRASGEVTDADYVVVERGEVRVGCCHHPDADSTPRRPPIGSEVVLRVDDVLAEHDHVVSRGWPLADQLETRPWGMTDFRVFDPTGQYLRITGPGPDQ